MIETLELPGADDGPAGRAVGMSQLTNELAQGATRALRPAAAVTLFVTTLFVNALLLFLVQPMFARLVLPLLGGSAAVWTACMLFFQSVLLAGYLYAHASERLLGTRGQTLIHTGLWLLPFLVLPIGLPTDPGTAASSTPVTWLLRTFLLSVGLPFFVVATSAPLLQKWFSRASSGGHPDPYFLYAASNAGSLAALLLYPVAIEPHLPLQSQATLWTTGYALATVLVLICAAATYRAASHLRRVEVTVVAGAVGEYLSAGRRARWLLWSFAPSSLMLAVTAYASTDIAPVPLLWTVPLALYLVTFILAFGRGAERHASVARRAFPLLLLPLVIFLVAGLQPPLWMALSLHLLTFFALSLLCHGALAADRPGVAHLTEFYLWTSAGGMAGGLFNTVLAPHLFTGLGEYPLMLAIGCLALGLGRAATLRSTPGWWKRPALVAALAAAGLIAARFVTGHETAVVVVVLGAAALVCMSVSRDPARFGLAIAALFAVNAALGGFQWGHIVYASRTFFGIYRVTLDAADGFVTLSHGTTLHGKQRAGDLAPAPLTYYHREGPIGDVFAALADRRGLSVGAVGLGVGSLASYAQPGQQWRFYEIDPEVERIARDTRFFHYLDHCGSTCAVVIGDARLSLQASTATHDLIVMDAFSSDAIPVHLLTREALGIYLDRLASGGALAFHISNRHLNLEPELARLLHAYHLAFRIRRDVRPDPETHRLASVWVVAARTRGDLDALTGTAEWQPLPVDDAPPWTDDFSNLWSAISWQ
jgi:hypothetical protein